MRRAKYMSEAAQRTELMARIMDLEPEMLRVLGPAQAHVWVDVDLTMSQLKMMFVLHLAMGPGGSHGLRVSEVAQSLGVTLPTVTAVMDKLVERGLVKRAEDRLDRRQHVCRLTASGQELVHRLMAGRRTFTTALLDHLNADELKVFLGGMQMLLVAAERLRAASETESTEADLDRPPPARKAS